MLAILHLSLHLSVNHSPKTSFIIVCQFVQLSCGKKELIMASKEAEFASITMPMSNEGAGSRSVNMTTASSSVPGPSGSSEPAPAYEESSRPGLLPTASQPFNFPTDVDEPPLYSASSSPSRPIAIPQTKPGKTSPFLSCYAPSLLTHGVTEKSWRAFLDTMSAFLTAKVSGRAVSHAADVGRQLGKSPKQLGMDVFSHAKQVGKDISSNAKRGNVIGAALGTIGGAISIPFFGAIGTVAAATTLPFNIIGAVAQKPRTPYERAVAYAAVANGKWLQARGLQANIMRSDELAQLVGTTPTALLDASRGGEHPTAAGQLSALQEHIAQVLVQEKASLELAIDTLWLVLVPIPISVAQADQDGAAGDY